MVSIHNDIKLIEDLYSKVPIFKETLVPSTPTIIKMTNSNNKVQMSNYNNSIVNMDEEDDDNIYEFTNNRYSSTNYSNEMNGKTIVPAVGVRPEIPIIEPSLVSPLSYIA